MGEYKIYYFGKLKIDSNSNQFEQNSWSLDSFEKCMDQLDPSIPTLIYLEDLEINDCVIIRKLFLRLQEEGKIYSNLTIYNKTISAHKTIFQLPIFKKVLNIFPFNKIITICDNNVEQAVRYINKSISVVFDPSKPQDSCYSFIETKDQKGGNKTTSEFEQIYIFRIMETNNSVELESTWWFKYYFSIPPCAYGRLSQSSGTCWLNTVLNIMFLTEPIRQMLLFQYKTLDKELIKQVEEITEFTHIAAKNFPLKVVLWSMVRLLLIQKKKALTLDGNFIGIIASKVISLHEFGNENYWIENGFSIDFGNSYYELRGMAVVLEQMFESDDYFILFNFWTKNFNTREKINKIEENYNNLKKTFDDTTREQFIEIENKLMEIIKLDDKTLSLVRKIADNNKLITLKWSELLLKSESIKSLNLPKILIVPTFNISIKNIPEIIFVEDTEYKLNAMSIGFKLPEFNTAHVVSGLICGSNYYIYDSNGILTYDSWNKNVYNNYIDALNEFYNVNGFAYEYVQSFFLYVRI